MKREDKKKRLLKAKIAVALQDEYGRVPTTDMKSAKRPLYEAEGDITPNHVYNTKQAARLLGVSVDTMQQLCESRRVKAVKLVTWRLLGQSLIDYLTGDKLEVVLTGEKPEIQPVILEHPEPAKQQPQRVLTDLKKRGRPRK